MRNKYQRKERKSNHKFEVVGEQELLVHGSQRGIAAGGQANFILPKKGLSLFFKYEHEYSAKATTLGDTMVFGGTWTLRFPKNGTTP